MKRKILQLAIGVSISVFMLEPLQVAAAFDMQFYSNNNIDFTGPVDCSAEPGGSANLVGNKNAEKIWNFLVGNDNNLNESERLTPEQAAGVMGNLRQESGENFDPGVEEIGGGGGFGIAQWTNTQGSPRRSNLEKAAQKAGVKASDLGFQLNYLHQEAKSRQAVRGDGNEWEVLKKQNTIEDALVFWHDSFERSADSRQDVINNRGGFARDAYASFKDTVPTSSTPTPSDSSGCNSFTGGNLEQTTLAYAWPTKKNNGDTTPKPEYKTAIEKAKADGQYIGGSPTYPGIDCGGFVTRLLIDSGFETQYNHSGKQSSGAGITDTQEAWAKQNWELVGNGSTIDVGTLRPGDVAFEPGHTFVYVGEINGFDSVIASASLNQRAPAAGTESLTAAKVTWYRKK